MLLIDKILRQGLVLYRQPEFHPVPELASSLFDNAIKM